MPLISTSGALSYNKIPGGNVTSPYWLLMANQTYATGLTPQQFYDLQLVGSTLYVTIQYGGANTNTNSNYGVFKISQDFGNPLISAETNFLENSNITNNGFKNSTYGAIYLNTNVSESSLLLTGRATRTTLGNILVASQNLTNYGGSLFSSLDNYLNVLTEGYVDIASSYSYSFPPDNYKYWYREGSDVLMDATGNYYVGGFVNEQISSTTTNEVGYLTKFNGVTNTKIWNYVFNQTGYNGGVAPGPGLVITSYFPQAAILKFDSAGNILMMYSGPSQPTQTDYIKLLSFSPSGALNWQAKFGTTALSDVTFDLDPDDNIYIFTGTMIQKYDSSRNLLWSKTLSYSGTNLFLYNGVDNLQKHIRYKNGQLYVLAAGPSSSTVIAILDDSGNVVTSNKIYYTDGSSPLSTRPYAGLAISNNDMYIGLIGTTTNTSIMKVSQNGSIPGTGNYYVGSNIYLNYETISLTNSSNTAYSLSAGNLTVTTAKTTGYTDWSSFIEIDNTIQSTSNITLT